MYTKIFYSWQSDTNQKFNKNFIEDCIKRALKQLKSGNEAKVEWNLDRDTKGEIGTIDIVETIFKKINESHIFIGDITFIDNHKQENSTNKRKRIPNPNVLTELGYAAAKIGWENIITIFNSKYGKVEDLPFDIKLRRPLVYSYDETTSNETKQDIRKEFVKILVDAIIKCNPQKVNIRRKLVHEFSTESNEALRLVIDSPELWNLKLILELIKKDLEVIEFLEYEINNDLIYENAKNLEVAEFLTWSESIFTNTIRMLAVFENTLTSELQKTFQEEDEYIFAIKTKKIINRACRICIKSLELEKELHLIEVDENLLTLKQLLSGFSEMFSKAIKDLYENMSNAITNIEETGDISNVKIGIDIRETINKENIILEFNKLRRIYLN